MNWTKYFESIKPVQPSHPGTIQHQRPDGTIEYLHDLVYRPSQNPPITGPGIIQRQRPDGTVEYLHDLVYRPETNGPVGIVLL